MCGINGIIFFTPVSRHELQSKINLMQQVTKHRGPDESSVLIFDTAALGTNRLAIVSPEEQKSISERELESKFVVFNGEIVNHTELRKLIDKPPTQSESDTSIILPMFKKFGQDFIKKLAGMFTIAIYDSEKHVLQLWRDPLGIKPLYYYRDNTCVIFSSEIKAVYAAMDAIPEVSFSAIDHILRHRFQPGRETVFSEIKKVLPGETVVFKENEVSRHHYWKLTDNSKEKNDTSSVQEFRDLLTKVVTQNAQADVPGGYFTSGGLDSSLVTSIGLQVDSSPYSQPISIRFSPHAVLDEEYGNLLEKYLKKKFEWVTISDELARETLMELVPFLDEPLENPTHVGTFLMAKRAKELGIKSILTGDGSDEFFLGYERHACWFTSQDPVRTYPTLCWTMKPSEADELYLDEVKDLLTPITNSFGQHVEPVLDMDQALRFERWERLTEYHNMRLDRMTMAHGIEAKVPFLDHRIVEYSLQIPHKTLFGSSGKEWLEEVATPFLPDEILKRPKILFPSLPDQWLSKAGSIWLSEILLDKHAKIQQWMKPQVIAKYIAEHESGTHLRGKLLWAMASLELWLQNLSSWKNIEKKNLSI